MVRTVIVGSLTTCAGIASLEWVGAMSKQTVSQDGIRTGKNRHRVV
jgi:hypothetical protein